MNKLRYCIVEAFRSLREAKMVTVVSIITVAVTIFLLTAILLSLYNLHSWVSLQQQEPLISVFFTPETSDETGKDLAQELRQLDEIGTVRFSSRSEEYTRFTSLWGDEFVEDLDQNPFPPALYISSVDASIAPEELAQQIHDFPEVESIHYAQEWLRTLEEFQGRITRVLLGAFAIIFPALFFTIANTVKLTIYARKDLVINMEYLGASYWYIRMPFIIEGLLQGTLGAAAAWLALQGIRTTLLPMEYLLWFDNFLAAAMLIFGACTGVLGSMTALSKITQ
ncbi:cell division protein FtsX [Chitinivibrio alkaliphilus]|uniref:Cell division protein FtsX n=1 Tax=Chitinivibrio alkaliphilus ACht1 TaxID=1313304 RepID=U7D4T8_9BACT|nr:permease-like cell division protein FtsX [Chitinivibrio alkaliphilus]ERP31529.1 ell division protein FtsX [Chitinivibrio alkaliphilus ACht1]